MAELGVLDPGSGTVVGVDAGLIAVTRPQADGVRSVVPETNKWHNYILLQGREDCSGHLPPLVTKISIATI